MSCLRVLTRRPLVALLCLLTGLILAPPTRGQGGVNRAGLVVQHGDGTVFSTCVTFEEPSISGLELLRRAGVAMSADSSSGFGTIICALDGEGCNYPEESCFCRCQGASCTYWIYWHLVAGEWQYSQVGAADWKVSHGSVDGWVWGKGTPSQGEKPPATAFAEVCAPPPTAPPPATPGEPIEQSPGPTATPIPAQPTTTPMPAPLVDRWSFPAEHLVFVAIVLVLAGLLVRQLRRTSIES